MVNLCGKSAAAGPRVLSREATLCSKEDPHCTGYARIQGKGFAGFIFFAWLPWNFFFSLMTCTAKLYARVLMKFVKVSIS